MLYYTILYYSILYNAILYHTMQDIAHNRVFMFGPQLVKIGKSIPRKIDRLSYIEKISLFEHFTRKTSMLKNVRTNRACVIFVRLINIGFVCSVFIHQVMYEIFYLRTLLVCRYVLNLVELVNCSIFTKNCIYLLI